MAGRRRQNLLSSRRRVQDDGEDDDPAADLADDSQSEASLFTADDDQDADDSDSSHPDASFLQSPKQATQSDNNHSGGNKRRRAKPRPNNQDDSQVPGQTSNGSLNFKATRDVDAMVNGLETDAHAAAQPEMEFEETVPDVVAQPALPDSSAFSSARPHLVRSRTTDAQDYKARRDADPAFVPNRGGFFMHDQRTDGPNHHGPSSSRGRGRGRALGPSTNLPSRSGPPSSLPTDSKWDHDLHEYITELPHPSSPGVGSQPSVSKAKQPAPAANMQASGPVSMSKSVAVGTVALRIFLPMMKEPIIMSKKMTVKQHTKLPDLRPPLRRDKPVRISLPNHEARYIFPSVERSFIFIPRAQRPNQQRNRSRNRSLFPQSGSRRTSVFGGASSYASSIARSRGSSQAQDTMLSPTGSLFSRPVFGAPAGPSRPVVKLPIAPQQARSPSSGAITSSRGTPFVTLPQGSAYPLPSQPTFREHRSSQMTMHQPRPQKQVSVASIESPERTAFQVPQQQEQQPFHHQVPLQYSQPAGGEPAYYVPMGQIFPTGSTPLSNIPEGAINAQPFQPGMVPQQGYYPYPMQQPMFYYSPPGPVLAAENQLNHSPYDNAQVTSPMYMPQAPYFVPMLVPVQPGAEDGTGNAPAGMFAHESNGMVYYYNPAPLPDGSGPPPYTDGTGQNIMAAGQDGYYGGPSTDVVYYPQQ